MHSRLKSAPPPVAARTASTGSDSPASTIAVAPNSRASPSLVGCTSIPTIVVQPAIAAAITAASPTVPVPKTAMLLPAGAARLLSTAPAPVWIPQPKGAATSVAMVSGSLTTFRSPATASVANDDWPKKCAWTVSAPRERTLVPSTGRADAKLCSKKRWQYGDLPIRQLGQPPHESNVIPTRSPGATFVTSEPTAATVPAPS